MKHFEPELYKIYLGLKHVGITGHEMEHRVDDVYKLVLYTDFIRALDELEATGHIEILNDYQNKLVAVKRNDIGDYGGVQI